MEEEERLEVLAGIERGSLLVGAGDRGGADSDSSSSVPARAAKKEDGENEDRSLPEVILLKMRENEDEASSWNELNRSTDGRLEGCAVWL
jgi:hypothetical protein